MTEFSTEALLEFSTSQRNLGSARGALEDAFEEPIEIPTTVQDLNAPDPLAEAQRSTSSTSAIDVGSGPGDDADMQSDSAVEGHGTVSRQLSQSHMDSSMDGGAGATGQTPADQLAELVEISEDQLIALREMVGGGDLLQQAQGGEGGGGGGGGLLARVGGSGIAQGVAGVAAIGTAAAGSAYSGFQEGSYETPSTGVSEAVEGLSGMGGPAGPLGGLNPMVGGMGSISEFARLGMTAGEGIQEMDLQSELGGVPDLSSMLNTDSVDPLSNLLDVDGIGSAEELLDVDALDSLESEMQIDQLDPLRQELDVEGLPNLPNEIGLNDLPNFQDEIGLNNLPNITDELGLGWLVSDGNGNGTDDGNGRWQDKDGSNQSSPDVVPDGVDVNADLSNLDLERQISRAISDELDGLNISKRIRTEVRDQLRDEFLGR